MIPITTMLRTAAVVALAGTGLMGCSGFKAHQESFTCPATTTVPDLQTLADVASNGNQDTVRSAGRISNIAAVCDSETAGIKADLSIEFSALRTTPAVRHLDLPYFVAIADSTGNILGKQEFSVGVDFPGEATVAKTTDKITAHLPLKNVQLGNVYTVIVGFQLTQNELNFNRAHEQ